MQYVVACTCSTTTTKHSWTIQTPNWNERCWNLKCAVHFYFFTDFCNLLSAFWSKCDVSLRMLKWKHEIRVFSDIWKQVPGFRKQRFRLCFLKDWNQVLRFRLQRLTQRLFWNQSSKSKSEGAVFTPEQTYLSPCNVAVYILLLYMHVTHDRGEKTVAPDAPCACGRWKNG